MSMRTGTPRPELQTYYWRKKLTPRILARDGWTCHLCGGHIDPNLRAPHPMSATIDHTRGAETGLDERYLKAAHRRCNEEQGDPMRFIPKRDPAPAGGTRWGV